MSTGAKKVSVMATGASPGDNGDKYVLEELPASEIKQGNFHLVPNETIYWILNNKVWLQPENESDTMCRNCDEGHSQLTPCSDGGQHSLLSHHMASTLAASSKDPNPPLRWASYKAQLVAALDVHESSVLAVGTRVGSPPAYRMDRRARKAACSSISAKTCVAAKDANMYSCLYNDDD
jgi:hypothetical protein